MYLQHVPDDIISDIISILKELHSQILQKTTTFLSSNSIDHLDFCRKCKTNVIYLTNTQIYQYIAHAKVTCLKYLRPQGCFPNIRYLCNCFNDNNKQTTLQPENYFRILNILDLWIFLRSAATGMIRSYCACLKIQIIAINNTLSVYNI